LPSRLVNALNPAALQLHERVEAPAACRFALHDKALEDYEEDHLIPLEIGGAPRDARNLWSEAYAGPCGAQVKDKLENRLHALVCDGTLTLAAAAAGDRLRLGSGLPAVCRAARVWRIGEHPRPGKGRPWAPRHCPGFTRPLRGGDHERAAGPARDPERRHHRTAARFGCRGAPTAAAAAPERTATRGALGRARRGTCVLHTLNARYRDVLRPNLCADR